MISEQHTSSSRIRRIRARVRGGSIERNTKKSGVKGYTLRGGRLVRMTAAEKLHRRRGARKAKLKRRSHLARSLMKRRKSLRKRHSLGL